MIVRESFSCLARIWEGDLIDREALDLGLSEFVSGVTVQITIEVPGARRTSAQNRFFWGPVCDAFRALGYERQETHDLLCLRFLPRPLTTPEGYVITVPGHTSLLNVREFNEFLDSVIRYAAEHDIVIQDSEQWRKDHPV